MKPFLNLFSFIYIPVSRFINSFSTNTSINCLENSTERYKIGTPLLNIFLRNLFFPDLKIKIFMAITITAAVPLVYLLVYRTGGIKYVYSHTMYLPIIAAGIFFGFRGGLVIALVGGILLGPLIPIDVLTGEEQLLSNWIYRLAYFMIIAAMVGLFSDTLKSYTKKIKYLSTHNDDTGIINMNGTYIEEEMINFLDSNEDIIVIAVSWNNYINISNILGHEVCSQILTEIHKKLMEHFPVNLRIIQASPNKLFLCIKGKDEVFYLNQVTHMLNQPTCIKGVPYYVEFSTGLTRYEKNHGEINPFQRAAIAAVYAKQNNIPSIMYEDDQTVITRKNLLLLGEFPRALENREITMEFQPKVQLNNGITVGLEALIRWDHPEKGRICPGDFIPLVEESQLIHPLTEFVLERALLELENFSKRGIMLPISINISPKNLQNPRFLEQITAILDRHGEVSKLIEFEITESALMCNPEKIVYLLEYLKNYKLILSIDDFGTGYSSLSYLTRFPVDVIKIDKIFVQKIFSQEGMEHIVKSTIDLAHNLDMKVTAEGIENRDTEKRLLELGCDMGQGFLYSAALKSSEIDQWISNK